MLLANQLAVAGDHERAAVYYGTAIAHQKQFGTRMSMDLVNRSYAGTNFVVLTYPDGLPCWATVEDPHETAFIYHVQASATPMSSG